MQRNDCMILQVQHYLQYNLSTVSWYLLMNLSQKCPRGRAKCLNCRGACTTTLRNSLYNLWKSLKRPSYLKNGGACVNVQFALRKGFSVNVWVAMCLQRCCSAPEHIQAKAKHHYPITNLLQYISKYNDTLQSNIFVLLTRSILN